MAATFIAEYAAANAAASAARTALETALKHVTPPTPELHQIFLTTPDLYAEALRKIADILLTLPALRDTVATTAAVVAPLAERACFFCHGTGLYQAPTSHYTQGRPVCWKCGGTGESAKSRKAAATA